MLFYVFGLYLISGCSKYWGRSFITWDRLDFSSQKYKKHVDLDFDCTFLSKIMCLRTVIWPLLQLSPNESGLRFTFSQVSYIRIDIWPSFEQDFFLLKIFMFRNVFWEREYIQNEHKIAIYPSPIFCSSVLWLILVKSYLSVANFIIILKMTQIWFNSYPFFVQKQNKGRTI